MAKPPFPRPPASLASLAAPGDASPDYVSEASGCLHPAAIKAAEADRVVLFLDGALADLGEGDELGFLDGGARGLDALLRFVVGEGIAKGLDPLDPDDFLVISARLGSAFTAATKGAEAKAVKAAIRGLDVDWSKLSAKQKKAVFDEAGRTLRGAADKAVPRIEKITERAGKKIFEGTREAAIDHHGLTIQPSLSDHDERAVAWLRKSQSAFVRDAYQRRAIRFSQRARTIVADGLAKGLGDADIAEELAKNLTGLHRSRDYWQVVANVFSNRARTYSAISSYEEAGIARYTWLSMMDEATSVQCRFMHGRSFPTERASKVLRAVQELDDPEDIVTAQPWLRVGNDSKGQQVLFYETKTTKRAIARVEESALGRKDDPGKFSELTRSLPAGITLPPAHARCRSTIVPEV